MAHNLSAGVRVRLHSLQAAAQHNGVEGHLLRWNASKARWDVKLSCTGQELSVRPANVMPMCPTAGCGQLIGVAEAVAAGLKMCGKCRRVTYCSKGCQVAAWKGGHKQLCKSLQEAEGVAGRSASTQEALQAALFGTTSSRLTGNQIRVGIKMHDLFNAGESRALVKMAEEGLAVAAELEGNRPDIAARIYYYLGDSHSELCDLEKGLGLLQQARALAVEECKKWAGDGWEADDWKFLERVGASLGACLQRQGRYEKAIEVLEQSRAIALDQDNRDGQAHICNTMGKCYWWLQQFEKAIELFEHSFAIYKELGDEYNQAVISCNLGGCLSRHGQHDRAIACLKQAWAISHDLVLTEATDGSAAGQNLRISGSAACQTLMVAAKYLGEALLAQARAGHSHRARLLPSNSFVRLSQNSMEATWLCDSQVASIEFGDKVASHDLILSFDSKYCWMSQCHPVSAAGVWLTAAQELGHGHVVMSGSGRRFASHVLMDTQMNLARTAFFTGENGKAVKLLSKYLQWWVDDFGPHFCARCLQMIDQEAPMLKCGACRVARWVFNGTSLPCGTDCHACRAVADSEAWMGDAGTATRSARGCLGRAMSPHITASMAFGTRTSARC